MAAMAISKLNMKIKKYNYETTHQNHQTYFATLVTRFIPYHS
jgi:hypothetical protein